MKTIRFLAKVLMAMALILPGMVRGTAEATEREDLLGIIGRGFSAPDSLPRVAASVPWGWMAARYRVNIQTLYEQRFTTRGCDAEVPRLIVDNLCEFCGGAYGCDRWWVLCELGAYSCVECNGPCVCTAEGLELVDETGEQFTIIAVSAPTMVHDRLEGMQQLSHQNYGWDPEYGDSVKGAYTETLRADSGIGGSESDAYDYIGTEIAFLAALARLTRDGQMLDSSDSEDTYLRKLSGALASAAVPPEGAITTAPDPHYLRALNLVDWQRAYMRYAKGYDPHDPTWYGFPDLYPGGIELHQLSTIIQRTCSIAYFNWDECRTTAVTPTTWGRLKTAIAR